MTATVQIHEYTATDTGVDKTSDTIRFKSAVETTVDTSNRLTIPAADTDYSYTKQVRLYATVAASTSLEDVTAYSDGASGFGTGVQIFYDTAGEWVAETDADISGTDFFTKTSGATIDLGGSDITAVTGYFGDVLRLQMHITSTASPGALTPETLTMTYDET